MCKNATATAASLMQAIEPTLTSLMNLTGVANTPDGQAAIKAYGAALAAVQAWQPGTTAQTVVQLVNAFTAVFDTLPIPSTYVTLENIIAAGIVSVVAVLNANSPAPAHIAAAMSMAPPEDMASEEETTAHYQVHVIGQATAQIQALAPHFKRSIFTSASSQYKKTWNEAVDSGGFPGSLKV